MNDYLYAHKKSFIDDNGQQLTIYLDANLKKNILSVLRFEGNLCAQYSTEIEKITASFLNQKLDAIPKIILKNSLPLWLFYSAFDEFQGNISIGKNNFNDLVCLCFGITERELNEGPSPMAGRACGSCAYLLKSKEFKKIAGMYPGPLLVKVDEFLQVWLKENESKISIEEINGDHLDVKISPYSKEKMKNLSDYLYQNLGVRFFFRATL